MRLPRKGILIRIVIYGGLLSYFGWQALEHYRAEQAEEAGATVETDDSGMPSRQYKLPDGRSVEVLEITPEQAEQMYGVSPSVMPGDPHSDAAPEKPPAEATPEGAAPEARPGAAPEPAPEPAPEAAPAAAD